MQGCAAGIVDYGFILTHRGKLIPYRDASYEDARRFEDLKQTINVESIIVIHENMAGGGNVYPEAKRWDSLQLINVINAQNRFNGTPILRQIIFASSMAVNANLLLE
jgi:hypothetical protein